MDPGEPRPPDPEPDPLSPPGPFPAPQPASPPPAGAGCARALAVTTGAIGLLAAAALAYLHLDIDRVAARFERRAILDEVRAAGAGPAIRAEVRRAIDDADAARGDGARLSESEWRVVEAFFEESPAGIALGLLGDAATLDAAAVPKGRAGRLRAALVGLAAGIAAGTISAADYRAIIEEARGGRAPEKSGRSRPAAIGAEDVDRFLAGAERLLAAKGIAGAEAPAVLGKLPALIRRDLTASFGAATRDSGGK